MPFGIGRTANLAELAKTVSQADFNQFVRDVLALHPTWTADLLTKLPDPDAKVMLEVLQLIAKMGD